MNPDIANVLAWVFLASIFLGVLAFVVMGVKWLAERFQPKTEFLSKDEQASILRKEAKNLYKEQEIIAEQKAVIVK